MPDWEWKTVNSKTIFVDWQSSSWLIRSLVGIANAHFDNKLWFKIVINKNWKLMIHGLKKTSYDVTVNKTRSSLSQWICHNYRYTYHVHRTARLTTCETLRNDNPFHFLTLNDLIFRSMPYIGISIHFVLCWRTSCQPHHSKHQCDW